MLNILCFTKTTLVHDNTFDVKIWDSDFGSDREWETAIHGDISTA